MNINLSPHDLPIFQDIIKSYKSEFEFYAFGSRVKGTHEEYSDLDLAVVAKGQTPIWKLRNAFEESNLTIKIDVVDMDAISKEFKSLIRNDCLKVGVASTKV